MAPKQKTFELIPTTAGLHGLAPAAAAAAAPPVLSRPPMTTKQAKKLYRKANKGPKLSKAEQRRVELLEQDRIRKELERERNQARARTARDRRKAKLDKEREDRKRRGLPLVDVHPSQDTISRFVNRGKSKEDGESATEAEAEIDTGDDDGEEEEEDGPDKENGGATRDGEERGVKRPRLSQHKDDLVERPPLADPASVSRAASVDIDDPVNQDLLQEQLLEDIVLASSRKLASSPRVPSPAEPPPFKVQEPVQRKPPSPRIARPPMPRPYLPRPPCYNNTTTKPTSPYLAAGRPRAPVPPHPGPPVLLPRPRGPQYHHSSSGKPKFLPKHLRTITTPHERPPPCPGGDDDVPTSTQLFLLDHVDDFFPSPSQEVHELREDDRKGAAVAEPLLDFPICTQDFTFSSQDMRDMETPSKPQRRRASLQAQGQGACAGDTVDAPADSVTASKGQLPVVTSQASIHGAAVTERPPSPPKKRMFGSSGPGAEVLVAMERSYQQSRREARARQEERRAQEAEAEAEAEAGGQGDPPAASQETDYGDIEIDLAFLEDTSWLDDDLDDDCL